MSITAETAKEHAKDPAVLCCRAEAGTVLQASNLEDPNIFPIWKILDCLRFQTTF